VWHRRPFGPWSFKERMFEKGELKFVILDLLAEKHKHGYEVIRDLEERLGGFYSPSPGAVYPTLQMLEDMGYVSSVQQDGKRVYQITEEGRAFLVERKETVEDIQKRVRSRFGPWFDEEEMREFAEEMKSFASDMKDFAKMFAKSQGGAWRDPSKRDKIREVLKRTRAEIDEILHSE
jgi:DNA-binding PadR family transcriptional regulator